MKAINIFLLFFISFSCRAFSFDLETLTLEEKVGQLLMVFFKGEAVNEDAKLLINQAHVGGIIYYQWANGLHSPQQIQTLSNGLQQLARESKHRIPLLISLDYEGGVVKRLSTGFTSFPGNRALGTISNVSLAEACFTAMSRELMAVGINMNLAPVVDVSSPSNPILGARSFGSSPQLVAELGWACLEGHRKNNVIASLKHFPGYGDVTIDPHLGLPVVAKSVKQLEQTELYPFRALAEYADAIMTAHIFMPALDDQSCATLSSPIIEGILRKQYGFDGVIVTDSLVMEALVSKCSTIEEAAICAFEAGHDILLFGGKMLGQKDVRDLTASDILNIHHFLVQAVKSGRIPEERLNASVGRILKLKEKYQLFIRKDPTPSDIEINVNTSNHQKLSKLIAESAEEISSPTAPMDSK